MDPKVVKQTIKRTCERNESAVTLGYVKLSDGKSCFLDLTLTGRKEMFHPGKASQLNLVILFHRCAYSKARKPPMTTIDTIGVCVNFPGISEVLCHALPICFQGVLAPNAISF